MIKKTILISTLVGAMAFAQSASRLTYPKYEELVTKHAEKQGLDKNLIWAVMGRESSGNPNALSNKNARGLMQVIPPTAARMGVNPRRLYDPETNIIAGTRYLRFLSDRFNGNLDYILAGYNAGEGAVEKYRGIPPYRETRKYVKNVKYRYARLSGNSIPTTPVSPKSIQTPQNVKDAGLIVYTSWVSGKKANYENVNNNTKLAKVIKTVRVKDVPKMTHIPKVTPVEVKIKKNSGFVQTLDANGNFISL